MSRVAPPNYLFSEEYDITNMDEILNSKEDAKLLFTQSNFSPNNPNNQKRVHPKGFF